MGWEISSIETIILSRFYHGKIYPTKESNITEQVSLSYFDIPAGEDTHSLFLLYWKDSQFNRKLSRAVYIT